MPSYRAYSGVLVRSRVHYFEKDDEEESNSNS
mgnify:CR=1 FL=1